MSDSARVSVETRTPVFRGVGNTACVFDVQYDSFGPHGHKPWVVTLGYSAAAGETLEKAMAKVGVTADKEVIAALKKRVKQALSHEPNGDCHG